MAISYMKQNELTILTLAKSLYFLPWKSIRKDKNSFNNTPDDVKYQTSGSSNIYQEKDSRSFTSLIPISSEEKEINEFLELQKKERINPIIEITHNYKTTRLELIPTNQVQNTEIKIPYNKRIEQDLRHNLSVFIKENNNKINNVFDIQISEFSLEVIIIGSIKVTAQNIADLFILAIKVRQKKILCWYCYYKAYEDQIEDIKRANKINNQSARTLVYNEIKTLLPDITDVNL
ncbi:hypothetical protein Glove_332g29 [Diversispora epigaea]|uniref:Uncharacterized protein n=1 Tax=Diversispora epigaea TaxID=1348612 RepID=A0A397HJ85_9GLOM|nr:hypothetical protein Glove_332g29 [Diversispora epigaea]